MNAHRVLRIPLMELVIVALILLVVGGLAILISVAWPLIHVPSSPSPIQTDPLEVISLLHSNINSNEVNELLDLFAEDAVVTDDGSVFEGKDAIRNWVMHSQRMAGLHLRMIHSQVAGEKVFWHDIAHNGPEAQDRSYILRWMALVQKRQDLIPHAVITAHT
jgi:ketosteroid isomerase-like protein